MYIVPLINIPSQKINIVLNYQDITLTVYTKKDNIYGENIYIDVAKDGNPLVTGQLIVVNQALVPENIGFIGNLYMVDMNGNEDPKYIGLGDRWVLFYAADDEI